MKDIAGQPLAEGDTVALTTTGYRNMELGTITRFTPKGMKVQLHRKDWRDAPMETYRAPDMVCKVVRE